MIRRAVWTISPWSGKAERVWTTCADVEIDVSDLVPPATARVHTAPIDEAALSDLLQRSRVA